MKEYFAISDIHGFYKEMRLALYRAGYRKTNPNHVLIVCGDIFDRGPDSPKVYKYLRSIPKSRRVLIRGNHEFLLRDMVNRGYAESHDISNGTIDTVAQFLDANPERDDPGKLWYENFENLGILRWIFGKEWVNYYELGDYIFVHSWIPVDTHIPFPLYNIGNYSLFTFDETWRDASMEEWEDATWGCPIKMYAHGLRPEGKTIVCGHWGTSDFHRYFNRDKDPLAPTSHRTYVGDGLIGLDATTAISGFCNVYKITL